MTALRFSRSRSALTALTITATVITLAACSSSTPTKATSASGGKSSSFQSMTVLLPWYADPEGGGFFAAKQEGLYTRAGIKNVTLQSGGPQVSETTLVATGKAQIGFTDAGGIVQAQKSGIPIVAIGALYQDNPVGVMVHADTGIKSFQQMAGKTWMLQTGGLYGPWVQKKLGISFKTQTYQGSIAAFLKNDSLVQQGWPTNEAYQAEQAGVKVNFIPFSTSGYNPYNDVFFTSKSFLAAHPDEVKAFLAASMQGWQDYMGKVSVAKVANAALLKANSQQTSKSVWYAWDKERKYVMSGDGKTQLGAMSATRWNTFLTQLVQLGQLKTKPALSDLYNASYLPKVSAPVSLPAAPTGSY